jgi:hypothetical protein
MIRYIAGDIVKISADMSLRVKGNRDLIRAPYEEAIKTLEATLAAHQSANSGETVRL